MAQQYHSESYLSRTVRWVRAHADEPATANVRYTNDDICTLLWGVQDEVMTDLLAASPSVPVSRYTFEIVADQELYQLPPNISEFHRLCKFNSMTGLPQWEVCPRDRMHPWGPGFQMEGLSRFRLTPIPRTGGESITIEYVPGGLCMAHQSVMPIYTGANDTGTQLLTTSGGVLTHTSSDWFLGAYDRRPNAYIGQIVRLLGTTNGATPSGFSFFPVMERTVNTYGGPADSLSVGWKPDIDLTTAQLGALADPQTFPGMVSPRTYVVYEVIPMIDPMVMWLATIRTAQRIVTIQDKPRKMALLENIYQKQKRTLLNRWSNQQLRIAPHMESMNMDTMFDDYE